MSSATPAPEEESEPEDCPKCPPVGAPAWMATFADMATLLMAFFVLILSFAEFNVPKFKQISGSLKDAFGVQQIMPVVEQPRGTTVLDLKFSPSPAPSITEELTQDTTDTTQPDVKIPSDNLESNGADQMLEGPQDREGLGGETQQATGEGTAEPGEGGGAQAERVAQTLSEVAASLDIAVDNLDGRVVVNLDAEDSSPEDLIETFKRVAQAIEIAGLAAGKANEEILIGGLTEELTELVSLVSELETRLEAQGGADTNTGFSNTGRAEQKAEDAAEELRIALTQEIAQGLVEVERRDGKVFVTLGAGGAFPSGSATLTADAREIIARVAEAGAEDGATLLVAGHTDNVPIAFGALFRDNWDLAAARAASVVQEMEATGLIPAGRMSATSYGETRPVADNGTSAGREQNRRIEIEIEFGG